MVLHQASWKIQHPHAIPESLATSPDAPDHSPKTDNSFGDILSEFEQTHHGSRNNEALEGTVVSISPESVFVDIGRKVDGVLPVETISRCSRRAHRAGGRQDAGEHYGTR